MGYNTLPEKKKLAVIMIRWHILGITRLCGMKEKVELDLGPVCYLIIVVRYYVLTHQLWVGLLQVLETRCFVQCMCTQSHRRIPSNDISDNIIIRNFEKIHSPRSRHVKENQNQITFKYRKDADKVVQNRFDVPLIPSISRHLHFTIL